MTSPHDPSRYDPTLHDPTRHDLPTYDATGLPHASPGPPASDPLIDQHTAFPDPQAQPPQTQTQFPQPQPQFPQQPQPTWAPPTQSPQQPQPSHHHSGQRGRAGRRRTPIRRVVAIGALALFVMSGTGGIGSGSTNTTHDGISRIVLEDMGSSDITIRADGTAGGATSLQTQTSSGWLIFRSSGQPDESVDGSTLTVRPACGGCDISITAPEGVEVSIASDSGNIQLAGTADFTVAADSGNITADGVKGDLNLTADSGDVTVENYEGGAIKAQADSGDVTIEADTVPRSITVATDSGDADIDVPDGRYAITVPEDSDVDSDLVAPSTTKNAPAIAVTTDSGRVTISRD